MKIVIESANERVENRVAMGSTLDIRRDPLEIAFSEEGGFIQMEMFGRTFEIPQGDFWLMARALCRLPR